MGAPPRKARHASENADADAVLNILTAPRDRMGAGISCGKPKTLAYMYGNRLAHKGRDDIQPQRRCTSAKNRREDAHDVRLGQGIELNTRGREVDREIIARIVALFFGRARHAIVGTIRDQGV